ncbi:hypothetical protein FIBSPDRAFT_989898 [Athelia psychrophila]|uniref:Uncharacterized protein n=1 Tax=Athelia psychrophila TaxID=1759441 RepID=A0A166WG17_9AGAM|nr:hypothetical protein FIBSPDRAFT_989898 [Fibularhizoctonia sp. CBS 109695]
MTPDSISPAERLNSFPGASSSSQPSSNSSSSYGGSGGQQDLEDTPNTSDEEWSSDEEDLDHKHEVYHPLNVIEKYLLEMTDARVVVTHESDWWPLSLGDVLPNNEEILERLHLHFDITTDGETYNEPQTNPTEACSVESLEL